LRVDVALAIRGKFSRSVEPEYEKTSRKTH
jgi:hypothetical protein